MHAVVAHPAFDAGARAAPPIPQDGSVGLTKYTDAQGAIWAWNPIDKEWQRLHQIRSGDTLWKMAGTYYGGPSLEGVHAIHHVPQNKAIQGGDANTGLIPNDIILIPQLPQPVAPPATSGGSVTPIGEVPQVPTPGVLDSTIPGFSAPGTFPIPVSIPTIPGEIIIPAPGEIPPPEAITVGAPAPAAADSFWTTGKMVAAGAAVVAGAGILWAITRNPAGKGRSFRRRRRN